MIIDTTLFNNEFDMLDIHLSISENYVDRWIILEANKTLNGRDNLTTYLIIQKNTKKNTKID